GFTDDKTVLDAEDDAAAANWGGNWRMPTLDEIKELLDNTTNEWTELNGVKGRKFTAKNGSGNFIFLPASGYRDGGSLYSVGSYSYYWSSSLGESHPAGAYYLSFGSGYAGWGYGTRQCGQSVRPVAVKTAGLLLNADNFPDANFRAALASILKISEGDEITDEMIQKRKIMNVSGKNISDFTGIEHFTALTTLNCSGNQISGEAMDALIASLPTVEDGTFIVIDTDDESEGNVITKSQVAAAKAKGWTVYDANYDEYEGSEDPVSETEIVLQRKYRIHNGSGYNEPAIHLDFGNGQVLHVGYLDTGWWGDYSHTMHGVYIIAGEDWVKASGEDVWRVASTIKDQWVTEKLIVDFNGKVKYYMNGELMGEHTFPGLDLSEAKDVSLDFSPFGWWTGHSHYMDDFSLTTPLASVSDDFNDGVLDADLWQEPVNPDGVIEEGGILKMEMLVTDWDYHLKTKTPIPLRLLSENKMFVRMGDTKTAKILVEGECSAASGNEEVATAVVNGDKVEITGVSVGNTTITVTHNESGKTATIDVTVTAGLLLIEGFFPDANFRAALASKFGINEGDEITDEMIAGATQFSFSSKGIADMTGVEYFTELRYLYIYYNQIAKLDVSMLSKLLSLDVDGNQLTELDITKNTALASLDCRNNQLTELDLTQNTALTALYCFGNKLTALDVTQNTALTYLSCYNNQLTALDVTQNTALQTLNCRSNRLTALDVTQNTALQELYCYSNQLTALDVTQNTSLTRLDCNYNKLTELDLSKNTQLTTLYCGNNQFAELDLSNQTNLGTISISTQYLATKAVKLADGRVGIDLGVEGFDWSRVSELKGDGTEMEAVFSGQYLVIADKVNDSPGKVTYQYDTQHPTEATTMAVEITVDLSEFPSGILLNEENFPDANFRAALASI
ncbi:MAG: pilus assembly protein N-terminal domain-containing protein, partial [Prevotella sp.]|nr:pilus assembly protein N-terminal domain-containing protein [Prevotella sp.]